MSGGPELLACIRSHTGLSNTSIALLGDLTVAAVGHWERGGRPLLTTVLWLGRKIELRHPECGLSTHHLLLAAGYLEAAEHHPPLELPGARELARASDHEMLIWTLPLPLAMRRALVQNQRTLRDYKSAT